MDRDEAIRKIRQCKTLPSLPAIAVGVLDLARRQDTSLRDISNLISNDPALSGKILRVVNSAFYGFPRQIATLSAAVVVLGLASVKTLVLGFSLVDSMRPGGQQGKAQLAYWRRSLYSAVAAQLLGKRLGEAASNREELFVAALLHDIGIPALQQAVAQVSNLGSQVGNLCHHESSLRRERVAFGLDHAQAGLVLAEQWGLPPSLAAAIRWHHHPRSADPAMQRHCRIVRWACLAAEVFMEGSAGSAGSGGSRDVARHDRRARRYAQAAFGLGKDACDGLLSEIGVKIRDLTNVFEVNIGEQRSYQDITDDANETLQQLAMDSQLQAQQFQASSQTDPLTGLANRRQFQRCLESEFQRVASTASPLCLVFVDLDRFKTLNDSLGHAAGDDGLRHIAALLQSLARPVDTVARYGGDEFVVLCPGLPLARTIELAEEIRQKVQAIPAVIKGHPWPLTVSLGVAEYDGKDRLCQTADDLLGRADKAAYDAKNGGRNAVRAFSSNIHLPDADS